jgi:hypothetical protein
VFNIKVLLSAFANYCIEHQVVFNSVADYKDGVGRGATTASSSNSGTSSFSRHTPASSYSYVDPHFTLSPIVAPGAQEIRDRNERRDLANAKRAAKDARTEKNLLRSAKLQNEREAVAAEKERARQQSSQSVRSTFINNRGNNYDFWLSYSDGFPSSMADVRCLAMSEGGFVAVFDNGSVCYHGIDPDVAELLDRQHLSNIEYLSIGRYGQYYIAKTSGKEFFSGCKSFMSAIKKANDKVRFVSFGPPDTFYIQYEDGSAEWNGNIAREVTKILRMSNIVVDCLWLGGGGDYYLGYNSTWIYRGAFSKGLVKVIKGKRVKGLMVDGKTFVVRYS